MKEIKIEHLAYLLKEAKQKKLPQPIFFLGAGASSTGGIPLAGKISKQILQDYSESPFIRDLPEKDATYANLMDCLLPDQRDELLKKYIEDAKINVTHIYLAQLLKEKFVDYVLTVNFDNLMLRALALYNIFPATYDMAILKDFTTTTFKEKSVVYLHGQNHGLWLLNTPEEMAKVKNTVLRIFDSIKNKRPWVFIGYSGEDPVFDHIKNLGRFDNGLYWVTYNDNNPSEKVQAFLSTPNTNAFVIKGFDSDSFMLKLNKELELGEPSIIDKPFTALKQMLNEIVDIDDKEHFKGVKERLEISKRQVEESIQKYELGKIESTQDEKNNTEIDLLKKEIINLIISGKYEEEIISGLEIRVKSIVNDEVQDLLSDLYYNWGTDLGNLARIEKGDAAESLYEQAFEKFQKAIAIKADKHECYNNWGVYLGSLAEKRDSKSAEILYKQAFDKFEKAVTLKLDKYGAYYNWGSFLLDFAKTKKNDLEAESLYLQAFDKFEKVVTINPDDKDAYYNWGCGLGDFAKTKKGADADILCNQAFQKYQKAFELGGKCYNLACCYALKNEKKDALFYLDISLSKQEISVEFVEKDDDWKNFLQDEDFIKILEKYRK